MTSRRFRRAWRAIFLAAVTSAAISQSAPAQAPQIPEATMTISAVGRAEAAPDLATLTMIVTRREETAEAALRAMSDGLATVLDALNSAGIDPADIQTRAVDLTPITQRYDESRTGPPEVLGYVASSPIFVRVLDLPSLGGVIDAAVDSGANELRSLAFGVSDPAPVMDQARLAAIAEAQRRGALYAEAAGVDLGRLLSFSEGAAPGPRPTMRADLAFAEGASVPISEGTLAFEARVTLVYEMEEPGEE